VYSRGQYAKALEYYEKSLAIDRKLGDRARCDPEQHRAGVPWGQYAKALEYYEKSSLSLRKIGDVQGEGTTLNNIGLVYRSWGQYAKALEFYEKSLAIHRKIGDTQRARGRP
jgi:tetratricopeptide (TPR) repeat protein